MKGAFCGLISAFFKLLLPLLCLQSSNKENANGDTDSRQE